jgi:hypothetical protein
MRASTLCGLTTFAVLSFALPVWSQVAGGQSTAPNSTTAHSGPEPYTAEFKITTVKTLANGTTIAQDFAEVQAWDAHGRTMTAMTTVPASSNDSVDEGQGFRPGDSDRFQLGLSKQACHGDKRTFAATGTPVLWAHNA